MSRFSIPLALLAVAALAAGCASTPPDQLAARECKIAVADFVGKPAKNVTAAEQAEAEMRMSRLAMNRGGYASGTNVIADITRDCR